MRLLKKEIRPQAIWSVLWCVLFINNAATAQIPAEVFAGNERTTIDVLFFRFFRGSDSIPPKWLFFHRNRVSIDYRMTSDTYLPVSGSTEAISWNHPSLKGFAPVATLQILQRGLFPKAGIQYAHTGKQFTLFTWLVAGLTATADPDLFILARYTPKLTTTTNLFLQFEAVNTIGRKPQNANSFTQRFRIGISKQRWQCGIGADLQHTGHISYKRSQNTGVFLRHEF